MTLTRAMSIRLDEVLEENGITAYRLSRISGVSQSTLCDIRLERNKSVSVRVIHDLMSSIGRDISYFFDSPLFSIDNIDD